MDAKTLSQRNIPHHTSDVCAIGVVVPPDSELERAAYILNSGKRIAVLVGRGALKATDELEVLAETLGAPIIKALLGKAAVPDTSPYTTRHWFAWDETVARGFGKLRYLAHGWNFFSLY